MVVTISLQHYFVPINSPQRKHLRSVTRRSRRPRLSRGQIARHWTSMMLNWIKFRGGHARDPFLAVLQPSKPHRRLTQICEYKGMYTHTCTHMYVCTYTRAYIKHLTQTEAFGDRATGRRGERKRHANGKKEHREESRSAAQRAFYGVYATWAGILKSLIARRFNSPRIRIPLQRNGTSCTHEPTDPFPLSRWSDPARSSHHSRGNWFCGCTPYKDRDLYSARSWKPYAEFKWYLNFVLFGKIVWETRIELLLNRKLQIKASYDRYLNWKNL